MKRIGIIGCGWIFQSEHVLGYLATTNGYIHGFCDLNKELAEKAMLIYRNGMQQRLSKATTPIEKDLCSKALECKTYTQAEEMLPNVDGVDICTPPQFHIKFAKMAADAGKAVLCEKPLARTYLDAVDAFESLKKVPFYIFTQVIYNPIFKKGKEIIDSGKLGEITRIKNCHATLDLDHTISKENFWNPQVSGGGALKDIGPHAYSVMRYWLGKNYHLKSVKDNGIATRISERTIENKPNYKIQVDDVAKLQIEWENDQGKIIPAELEAFWGGQPKYCKFGLYHEIEGTKGTMIFPNGTLGLLLGKKPIFGIHVFFKIIYKDGRIEKISMPQPPAHSESLVAIDEFCAGIESRSPAWYGEDMMVILDSGYLSKKRNGEKITPMEFKKYCQQVGGSDKNAPVKLITDLFG